MYMYIYMHTHTKTEFPMCASPLLHNLRELEAMYMYIYTYVYVYLYAHTYKNRIPHVRVALVTKSARTRGL